MPASTMPTSSVPASWRPLIPLLLATALLIPFDTVPQLPAWLRLAGGLAAAAAFAWWVRLEPPPARRRLWALAAVIALLVVAPIDTRTTTNHMLILGAFFAAVLLLPLWWLRGEGVLDFRFWPRRLDLLDLAYTVASVPLAWGALALYWRLSPEVPFNWHLPEAPEGGALLRLFLGINAVGIWDELFFINTCYAILRSLYPARIAIPGQAVIYTSVLWDMAFTGWGPLFVLVLALTQGAMYERSRVLLWVLIVHLVVDYFLFQGIVEAYYPEFSVWWHP